jgi:hypothetical protein
MLQLHHHNKAMNPSADTRHCGNVEAEYVKKEFGNLNHPEIIKNDTCKEQHKRTVQFKHSTRP